MPVIVVASPKGGAGKTTSAVLLGTEYARNGIEVVLIDCDPNECLALWATKKELPANITLLNDVTEKTIIRTIEQLDGAGKIIIVDLQGAASLIMTRAISQADLVLTPMCATSLDAQVGARAIELVELEKETLGRGVSQAVVLTRLRAGPVRSKIEDGIVRSLQNAGVKRIEPSLFERAAFSGLFQFGGDLHTMPPQGNMEEAKENAAGFAQAVFQALAESVRDPESVGQD